MKTLNTSNSVMFKRYLLLGGSGGVGGNFGDLHLNSHITVSVLQLLKNEGTAFQCLEIIRDMLDRHDMSFAKPEPMITFLAATFVSRYNGFADVRRYAASIIISSFKTLPEIYMLVHALKELKGEPDVGPISGVMVKRAINQVLSSWKTERLVFQALKYGSRLGWTFKDVLRQTHWTPDDRGDIAQGLIKYLINGTCDADILDVLKVQYPLIKDYEDVRECCTNLDVIEVVSRGRLTREMIPTEYLNDPDVTRVLVKNMGTLGVIRNLANFTRQGLMSDDDFRADICARVANDKKMHPVQLLLAANTYSNGVGSSGATFIPHAGVVNTIDCAIWNSVKDIDPTGKHVMHCIDLSGSMFWDSSRINGRPTNPCAGTVAGAMAAISYMVEGSDKVSIVGFAPTFSMFLRGEHERLSPWLISLTSIIEQSAGCNLMTVADRLTNLNGGGTNISEAIDYATREGKYVDTFVFWTDNDLNAGRNVSEALLEYRRKVNPKATLITAALSGSRKTIADPSDPGMLDIVGFDANCIRIIQDFIRDGELSW